MIYDRGSGAPVVVIPGVQGRWEWMTPALDALSAGCRTVSYSLAGDFGSGFKRGGGFDAYLDQLDDVFRRAELERAALCGVSYGGVIALCYAATRPQRVSALILVSSPGPGWTPNARQRQCIRRPWLMTPEFVATGPSRLWPEIAAAFDRWPARIGFALRYAARIASAPSIPPLMASRMRLQQQQDLAAACARVSAPTLVVTGEPHLDRVVPVEATREYAALIPGARYEMMERTGHIGLVTRPGRFSAVVHGFVHAHDH